MLVAWGWAKIQASRSAYHGANFDECDGLDAQMKASDKQLFKNLTEWMEQKGSDWLRWQFSEHLNNDTGLLQFHTSRNHRTSGMWNLIDFIAEQSVGSYGVIYVHDDEDAGDRCGTDFQHSFRVWRILDGNITEHEDSLFSPFSSRNAFEF